MLLLCTANVYGQGKYFEKNIPHYFVQNGYGVEKIGNLFFVYGEGYDTQAWNGYGYLVDEKGIVFDEWYPSYEDYSSNTFKDCLNINSVIYCVGSVTESTDYYSLFAKKGFSDSSFDYEIIETGQAFKIKESQNGNFLIGGRVIIDNKFVPYIGEFTIEGGEVWKRFFNDISETSTSYFNDIYQSSMGDIYATMTVNVYGQSTDIAFARLSSDGVILDTQVYDLSTTNRSDDFCVDDNGNFYLAGRHNTKGAIYKINPDLQITVLNNTFDNYGRMRRINYNEENETLLIVGTSSIDEWGAILNAAIYKMDLQGNVLWSRLYGTEEYDEYGWGMLVDDDGSIWVTGRYESSLPIDGTVSTYLLKTNCMGLLTEPQAAYAFESCGLITEFENQSLNVYPDSIDGGYYTWDFGDGTTSDEVNPTHSYTDEGVYQVSLTGIVCQDTSTVSFPVHVAIDTCYTFVDVPIIDEKTIKLYPNPVSDYLNISIEGQFQENLFLEIYGINGALLYEKEINSNNERVSIGRFESGLYTYVVYSRKGILKRGKLVVK